MSRKVILFDLDNTLIDSTRLKKDLFAAAKIVGASPKLITAKYKQERKLFTIEKFAAAIFPEDSILQRKYEKQVKVLLSKPANYNYPGIKNILGSLRKSHTLILVTYGASSFQRDKIRQSLLRHFFQNIIITADSSKRSEFKLLQAKYSQELILFDNSAEVCRAARAMGIGAFKLRSSFKDVNYYREIPQIQRLLPNEGLN